MAGTIVLVISDTHIGGLLFDGLNVDFTHARYMAAPGAVRTIKV